MKTDPVRLLLVALIAASLVIGIASRIHPVLLDDSRLVTYTADDMYYYLKIADNLQQKGVLSFDGEIPTNGFHPLYLGLLRPLFSVVSDAGNRIRAASLMLVLVDLITALLLYLLMAKLKFPTGGALLSAIWLCSPFAAHLATNGMESVLAGTGLVMCCLSFVAMRSEPDKIVPRLFFGFSLAFVFLARTDSAWYVVCFVLWAFVADLGSKNRQPLSRAFIAPALSFVLVSPWLGWNLFRFGSIAQTSFSAHLARLQYTHPQGVPFFQNAASGIKYLLSQNGGWVLGVVALFIIIFWGATFKKKSTLPRFAMELACILFAGSVLFYVFYWAVGLSPHSHYLAAPSLSLLIITAALFAYPAKKLYEAKRGWQAFSASVLFIVLFTIWSILPLKAHFQNGKYFWQERMLAAAKAADERLPNDARIASFNAGVAGYFCNRSLVNIDGVVNPEAIELFTTRSFDKYLRQKKVDYLLDHAHWLSVYSDAFGRPVAENYELVFGIPCTVFKDILCLKRKPD